MAKAFKKGEAVTYIADWDCKGTVYFRHAIVYSCGAKQMVLTDSTTGVEMGRNFRPIVGEIIGTFPRMSDEAAVTKCLEAGASIVASERARFDRCLAAGHGESYNAAIREDIDQLHEPRAIKK